MIGVPGRPVFYIQIQEGIIGRGYSVETIEVIHHGIPVGDAGIQAMPLDERGRFEIEMRIPGPFGGIGRREPGMVQEVGIGTTVPIVEKV